MEPVQEQKPNQSWQWVVGILAFIGGMSLFFAFLYTLSWFADLSLERKHVNHKLHGMQERIERLEDKLRNR